MKECVGEAIRLVDSTSGNNTGELRMATAESTSNGVERPSRPAGQPDPHLISIGRHGLRWHSNNEPAERSVVMLPRPSRWGLARGGNHLVRSVMSQVPF